MENVVYEPLKSLRVGDPPIGSSPGAKSGVGGARVGPRSRRALGAAFAVGLGVAALGGTPAVASAADDCPNAAVRAQQQSQHLPNCMAYEKVSPAGSPGAPARAAEFSPDGSIVRFLMSSAPDGGLSYVGGSAFLTKRPTDGSTDWPVNHLSPTFGGVLPVLGDDPIFRAASTDFTRFISEVAYGINPNDQGRGVRDVYIRESDGSFTWVTPDPSIADASLAPVNLRGYSRDFERVVVATERPWDPRVTAGEHVYVHAASGTHLATILPDGSVAADLTAQFADVGVTRLNKGGMNVTQPVSADGRRVGFTNAGRFYVRFNADDPGTAVTREVAVGPNGETCSSMAFRAMSEDGTKVMFTCAAALFPGAPAGSSVYVRDLDGGPSAVRSIGDLRSGLGGFAAANADFSRIYLSNGLQLGVSRDGGPLEEIARQSADPNHRFRNPQISPDGEYLAFESNADFGLPGVDVGSGSRPSQVYRYSAHTDTLTCISCRQDGSPTGGVATFTGGITWVDSPEPVDPVADDGSVTFASETGLDATDTNGVLDAYAWIDGRQVLLSSGRGDSPSGAVGQSRDGRSKFFSTAETLVPNDQNRGAYDTYVARVDGGVLIPDSPAPCTANCQAPAPERPGLPSVGTEGFVGRGNLVEKTTTADESPSRAKVTLTASSSVRGASTSVRVKVSRAGSIRVSGAGLRPATVKAKKAGTYRVTVRLSANGVKQQKQRGRLATRVTARFTPKSGASASARKSVTFTAKKGGR